MEKKYVIDSHVHIEHQPYTLDTINNIVHYAVKNGVDEVWLVDHTHKFKEFKGIYAPVNKHDRARERFALKKMISIQEYLDFIDMVKSKEWPINIKFGLEVCYFKDTEMLIKELLKKYPFEIRIGSVHHTFNMPYDEVKEFWDDYQIDDMYHEYYKNNYSLIESKLFTHMGHPDAIKRFNHYPSYDLTEEYEKLAKMLVEYNLPTENNSGFARYGFEVFGLGEKIKEVFKKYNVKILTSSDAHTADYVGYGFDKLNV